MKKLLCGLLMTASVSAFAGNINDSSSEIITTGSLVKTNTDSGEQTIMFVVQNGRSKYYYLGLDNKSAQVNYQKIFMACGGSKCKIRVRTDGTSFGRVMSAGLPNQAPIVF